MRIEKFILLTEIEKSKYLYKNACFIGKIKSGRLTLVLYQIDTFYVEIAYLKYRHTICNFRCGNNVEMLDNYLDQVNIDDAMLSFARLK